LDDTSGKTPATDTTPLQLHRRKTDALKLIIAYVYSVKHYLREEDGLEWEDYVGVIPESFSRTYSRQSRRSSVSIGYNAVSKRGPSVGNSGSASPERSRSASTDGTSTPAATKRVRVKRSSDGVATVSSPLIEGHSTIDLQAYDNLSIPIPLVFVE
jgi:ion channel-forming bestrophin family protein